MSLNWLPLSLKRFYATEGIINIFFYFFLTGVTPKNIKNKRFVLMFKQSL